MASERIGKIYEAIIVAAISDHEDNDLCINWDPVIPGLLVRPDIVIGPLDNPRCIALITRSGSRRNWHMKFWRNVGEIYNIRSVYPLCSTASISLGTEPKEQLIDALDSITDLTIYPTRQNRELLENWANSLLPGSPKGNDQLLEYIKSAALNAPDEVKILISNIGKSLISATKNPPQNEPQSFCLESKAKGAIADSVDKWAKPPCIRRGLAKLLTFGLPNEVVKKLDNPGQIDHNLGVQMSEFGWATRSAGGWRLTDRETRSAIAQFPSNELSAILELCSSDKLRLMCKDVESPDWLRQSVTFMEDNIDELSNPSHLGQLLWETHGKPGEIGINGNPPGDLPGSWLFRLLSAFLKACSGKKQGFGYEQLIADIRFFAQEKKGLCFCRQNGISWEEINRCGRTDSLRRKLVDWVSGLNGEINIPQRQIFLVAECLSLKLQVLEPKETQVGIRDLTSMIRKVTYEDRIAPYSQFEPLRHLIESVLNAAAIDFSFQPRHPTVFTNKLAAGTDVASIPVISSGGWLIHWKSAYGTHHKTKELCGRGPSLVNLFTCKETTAPRLMLVLDGDFPKNDVEHLLAAGWDSIVASTNIDKIPSILTGKTPNGVF